LILVTRSDATGEEGDNTVKERRTVKESIKDVGVVDYSFNRIIKPEQLQVLFRQTEWADDRGIEGIQKMLEATPVALGAWEEDRLIGFARTITDGIYRALIDDVVVEESRRGRGIGSELMRRLLKRLTDMEVEEIFLRCGGDVVPFYQRHGFERTRGVVMDLKQN
jgi:GNAT superfamily N-acetyltransferase